MKKNYLWLLPFYMAVGTYCYYEKVCRMMRSAIVLYLLKQMLHRLPIAFAQVKTGNLSENLLNEIFQIILLKKYITI